MRLAALDVGGLYELVGTLADGYGFGRADVLTGEGEHFVGREDAQAVRAEGEVFGEGGFRAVVGEGVGEHDVVLAGRDAADDGEAAVNLHDVRSEQAGIDLQAFRAGRQVRSARGSWGRRCRGRRCSRSR